MLVAVEVELFSWYISFDTSQRGSPSFLNQSILCEPVLLLTGNTRTSNFGSAFNAALDLSDPLFRLRSSYSIRSPLRLRYPRVKYTAL